jgi:two-component system, OmpR family, response regulator
VATIEVMSPPGDDPVSDASQVAILWWPEDAGARPALRASGVPCLLLVAPDAEPPDIVEGEDWIRRPTLDTDVRARATALVVRGERASLAPPVTTDGRIHYRGRWASVSDTERSIAQVLADHFGDVVELPALVVADGLSLSNGSVRVHLTRLRKRIRPIGLVVKAVRGRGYVLDDERRSPQRG